MGEGDGQPGVSQTLKKYEGPMQSCRRKKKK